MRLPASVTTFAVLLVALLGTMIYVDGLDLDTEVQTADETRLPLTYPADVEPDEAFLRYPRGWNVLIENPLSFLMFVPSGLEGEHQLRFQVIADPVAAADVEATLRDAFPDFDADHFETTDYGDYEAAVYRQDAGRTEGEDVYNYFVLTSLSDEMVIFIDSQTPLSEDDWNDLEGDLERVLASANPANAPEMPVAAPPEQPPVQEVPPVSGLILNAVAPEGWERVDLGPNAFALITPNQETPEAVVQFSAIPRQTLLMQAGLTSDQADPAVILETVLGADPTVTFTEPIAPVSYMGYEGAIVTMETINQLGETVVVEIVLLATETDEYILVQNSYLTADAFPTYQTQVEEILESATYQSVP